jgi:hypothetical protein
MNAVKYVKTILLFVFVKCEWIKELREVFSHQFTSSSCCVNNGAERR